MSSPNLNNSIIIGCILTYLSVFLLGADSGLVPAKFLTNLCAVSTITHVHIVLYYLQKYSLGVKGIV